MYEIFYYVGLVFSIGFFVLSVVLFFTQKIPEVIRFNFKMKSIKPIKLQQVKSQSLSNKTADMDDTELLDDDETQLLNIAQNFATALLDAENISNLDEI